MRELDEFEVALGTEVFDPAEAEPLRRRSIGDRPDDAPDPNDTRIVQFHRTLTGPDQDRLKDDYGLALSAYVPNLAYVERVDAATRRRLANDPLVRAIGPYRPEYKLDALLADPHRRTTASSRPGSSPCCSTVGRSRWSPTQSDRGGCDRHRRGRQPSSRRSGPGGVQHGETGSHRAARPRSPTSGTSSSTARSPSTMFLPSAMIQSGDATKPVVWDRGIHGEGQVIGQLEGATLDIAHCFFTGTIADGGPKVIEVRNAQPDDDGTPTFVAGCAVGDEDGNSGAHAHRGSAWAAQLVASRDDRPRCDAHPARGQPGRRCDDPHQLVALPAHAPGPAAPYNRIAVDTDRSVATTRTTSSSGPPATTASNKAHPGLRRTPCACPRPRSTGRRRGRQPGPTADGRRKPDIVAVGCAIRSAVAGTPCGTHRRWLCDQLGDPARGRGRGVGPPVLHGGLVPDGLEGAGQRVHAVRCADPGGAGQRRRVNMSGRQRVPERHRGVGSDPDRPGAHVHEQRPQPRPPRHPQRVRAAHR